MSGGLLTINNLTVKAGSFELAEVAFSLKSSDYLVILGPTGCGKTVLLETIAGLRQAEKGSIMLEGVDIIHVPAERRGIGFVYQDSLLYPFLTVRENILFAARARGLHKCKAILHRLTELAEATGIAHLLNRRPDFLSGGERQRVALARAVLTRPRLLLLDEPLSALDPQTRLAMQELLRTINRRERLAIIHVTHNFIEAMQLGSRLVVMSPGRIEQQGKPEKVLNHPINEYVAAFLHAEKITPGRGA